MITNTNKDMMSLNEVSKDLNRSLEQVRRYVREGKLHAHKIGLQWFVPRSDLKKFISSLQDKNIEELDIVERARAVREKIKAEYGEMDGLEILDDIREERFQEL